MPSRRSRRNDKPAQHCKRWTAEDDQRFRDMVSDGVPNVAIAAALERTVPTINQRKIKLKLVVRVERCQRCDIELAVATVGRPRQYCDPCAETRHLERSHTADRERREAATQARTSWVCEQCETPLSRDNPWTRFCSKKCSTRAWHERNKDSPARKKAQSESKKRYAQRQRSLAERTDVLTMPEFITPTPAELARTLPPPPLTEVVLDPSIPVSTREIDITPELAGHWLTFNTHNRPLKMFNLEKISRDLREGRWQYTAEPVKFSKTGVLLDGQHRLHAVVRTGITARMLVVPGINDEAQDVMDTGAARGAADVLALAGESNTPILAAAIRIAISMERGGMQQKNVISNAEIFEWLNANDPIREAVNAEAHLKRILMSRSVIAYCIYRLSRLDHDAAVEFFNDLAEHRTEGAGDPRSALLSRLTTARQQGIKLTQAAQISLIFRTWNFVRTGRALSKITVHYSGNTVDIPVPQ